MSRAPMLTVRIKQPTAIAVLAVLQKVLPARYFEHLQHLSEWPKGIRIEIRTLVDSKSAEQVGYYWRSITPFAKWLGYNDVQNLHNELKKECALYNIETLRDGTTKKYLKSSNDLTVEEYSELITMLLQKADFADYRIEPPLKPFERGNGYDPSQPAD